MLTDMSGYHNLFKWVQRVQLVQHLRTSSANGSGSSSDSINRLPVAFEKMFPNETTII